MKSNKLLLSIICILSIVPTLVSAKAVPLAGTEGKIFPKAKGREPNSLHSSCRSTGDKTAAIFGVNDQGIALTENILERNSNLLEKIIAHELTIQDGRALTRTGNLIKSLANRKFPVTNNMVLDPPIRAPGLGVILNPDSFNLGSDNSAGFTGVSFLPKSEYNEPLTQTRNACEERYRNDYHKRQEKCSQYNRSSVGGMDISNFNLYDLTVDYDFNRSEPSIEICGKFKLNVKTDISIGVDTLREDIRVNNINVFVGNGKKHCFRAGVSLKDFSIRGITRISSGVVLERSEIDRALQNPHLTLSGLPNSHLLASLSDVKRNKVIIKALAPILSQNVIQSSIENPIIDVVKNLLETIINDYSKMLLSNELANPLTERSFDLPSLPLISVSSGLQTSVDNINSERCRSKKKRVKSGIKSIAWLIENNPEYSSKQQIDAIKCFNKLSSSHKREIDGFKSILSSRKSQQDARGKQMFKMKIRTSLNKIPFGGHSISTYTPDLCLEGDIMDTPLSADRASIRSFITSCQGAYSLLNMEAINNTLALPQVHKSLCSGTRNYSFFNGETRGCELKVVGEKQSYADEKVTLSCLNFNPLTAVTNSNTSASSNSDLSFSLRASLEGCVTKGVLGLGTLKDAGIDIFVKIKLQTNGCAEGAPICSKLIADTVELDENGRKSTIIPGVVKKKFKEQVAKLLPALEKQVNQMFLNKNLNGFSVYSKFQTETTHASSGIIGLCLKPTAQDDAFKRNLCLYANKTYGTNNIVSSECAGIN